MTDEQCATHDGGSRDYHCNVIQEAFGGNDCRGSDFPTPAISADIGLDDPTAFEVISFSPLRLIPILLICVLGN